MNNNLSDVFNMIQGISAWIREGNVLQNEEIAIISGSIAEINNILFGYPRLKFQKDYTFSTAEEWAEYGMELEKLQSIWLEYEGKYAGVDIDRVFWKTYYRFKYVDRESMIDTVIKRFNSLDDETKNMFADLNTRYSFLTTSLNYQENDYSIIEQHVDMMIEKVEEYRWLYERLGDYRSKAILNGIISFWFNFDIEKLHAHREFIFRDYYDPDILRVDPEAVLVDCGAYDGDSVKDYISAFSDYGHVYAFEMTPGTYEHLQKELSGFADITCINKAVGKEKTEIFINNRIDNSGNSMYLKGDTRIEVTSIDDEIPGPVSIIKMDIEGAEKDAIIGAKEHIVNDKPQLLISAYHIPGDIFDIPILIENIRDDYSFYLRFNGRGVWPCDYVIFAV